MTAMLRGFVSSVERRSRSSPTRWCIETFGVVRNTVYRDLVGLVDLDLLVQKGAGRGVTYVTKDTSSA